MSLIPDNGNQEIIKTFQLSTINDINDIKYNDFKNIQGKPLILLINEFFI